jgi:hypothetical protein
MFLNGTYSMCFMDELFSHCMEKILLASDLPRKQKRDSWLDSWVLALVSLLEAVGGKLEQQSQMKDEKVSENMRAFIERVQTGLVASVKVSNQIIFAL